MTSFALLAQTGAEAADQLTATAAFHDAVMQSFQQALNQFIMLAPKALMAVVVLVIGYIVARLVSSAVTAVAERLGLQRAAESGGLVQSMKQVGIERTVPQIVGTIVFWLLMCVFLVASFDILDMPALTGAMEKVIAYIPKLLVATFVVVLGLLLAAFLKGVVATSADRVGITYAPQLATACYWVLALLDLHRRLRPTPDQLQTAQRSDPDRLRGAGLGLWPELRPGRSRSGGRASCLATTSASGCTPATACRSVAMKASSAKSARWPRDRNARRRPDLSPQHPEREDAERRGAVSP